MQILGIVASSQYPGIPDSDLFSLATATVLDTSTSTVTLSGIPTSGYKHLHLRWMCNNGNGAADAEVLIRFNGDSGNNYSWRRTWIDGVDTNDYGASSTGTNGFSLARATSNVGGTMMACGLVDIVDYSSTSKNKNISTVYGNARGASAATNQFLVFGGGSWTNTSAITSISFVNAATNFGVNSKFALYGYK